MLLPLLLALALQASPAPDSEPPEEMIDFLGRRRLCAELPAPPERSDFQRSEERRLACASLAAEEARWRRRYRDDRAALAWLDRDPRDFRVPRIVVSSWDGPPPAYVHRVELSGTETGGPAPFHLVIDSDSEAGAATLVTASYAGVPARSFRIANDRIPWLDLQSLRVSMGGGRDYLHADLRFGHRRGYCGDEGDDRPRLILIFRRDRVTASADDRTNCASRAVPLALP